jgi:hypothetical protein
MNIVSTAQAAASSVTNNDNKITRVRSRKARYFFVSMACLFIIMAVIGFTPSYQAIYSGQDKRHWFAHVHGAIMTSWLLVFLTQGILAAKGNLKFHRRLGLFSVVLGVLVWLAMGTASVRARIAFPPPLDSFLWDVLLIELSAMNLFGLFFTWGILVRKKAAAHKRLLFFATMVLLQAAVDRTSWLPGMDSALYVRFIYLDALIIPLLIYDLITMRRIHKMTMIGSMIIIMVQIGVTNTWGSPAWHQFWFNRLAPFVEQMVEVKPSDAQTDPLLGDYGDKNWHMTVYRDAGKLYLKLPDQPKFEMAATAENEWFLRTMIWKVSFIRGKDGSVTKIINKQPTITWEAHRLK